MNLKTMLVLVAIFSFCYFPVYIESKMEKKRTHSFIIDGKTYIADYSEFRHSITGSMSYRFNVNGTWYHPNNYKEIWVKKKNKKSTSCKGD